MDINEATNRYETWLANRAVIVPEDLAYKHEQMKGDIFSFFRASYYHWAQLFPKTCADLMNAPTVLSVGDLHIENFGTWRDAEDRLAWGVNDFDEAYPLPFTNDLVRLATSALLGLQKKAAGVKLNDVCSAILEGYTKGLANGGCPFVLAEHHEWLLELATASQRDPKNFWAKLDGQLSDAQNVTAEAKAAIDDAMPEVGLQYRIKHRRAGLGSLGRQRYATIVDWRGGKVAREAKALVVSASDSMTNQEPNQTYYDEILRGAVRDPDPIFKVNGKWIVRRLAPDSDRIKLDNLPAQSDYVRLFKAMGCETANVHLGTKNATEKIKEDLQKRNADWLRASVNQMQEILIADWNEFSIPAR